MMKNDGWVMGKGWAGHDKGTDDTNDDEHKRMMVIMMTRIPMLMPFCVTPQPKGPNGASAAMIPPL